MCLSSILGIKNIDWISSSAEGTAGGMLIGWKTELFEINQIEYGGFSFSVRVRNKQDSSHWWLSCIYGPSIHSNKEDFWIELNDLGNLIDGLWCVGGDFNEILYSSDRKGTTTVNAHSAWFDRWVSDFSLIDHRLTNLRHTWSISN